ncbi:bifunctional diguanylate cyclase/phosphodiesterase [Quadrisphaera sp. INWT6]|uniref:putative bifunctional diguanylate cyclase/phosphodiesterase n=1 Tax=Quadrisphaera sp. INWT6 TaxID=2596917 RepID=UPI0018920E4A|nr:bifunctional diguanylate cyclase/phosphodiesterase [Quadrisphaera sp. INWT6]MBF5083044.1 GGDEF domain-containing protein [Quadrisphaera sp. INWT6]
MDLAAAARTASGAVRRLSGPGPVTAALIVAVAAGGVVAALHLPPVPLVTEAPLPGWVGLVVLCAAFVVAEVGQIHVEIRRQAYSFSLTGVPLLLGALYCPPDVLVVARLASAAAVFAAQRLSPVKSAFNLSAYLLDTALVVLVAHQLVQPSDGIEVATGVAAYAAMAVSDVVTCALILAVIQANTRSVSRADVVEIFLTAAPAVVVSTHAGLLLALLASTGSLGWGLAALTTVTVVTVHQLHTVLRRRHASLQLVKDFVEIEVDGPEQPSAAGDRTCALLQHVRTVLRAEHAQLLVPAADGDGWTVLRQAHEDPDSVEATSDAPVTGRRAAEGPLLQAAARGPVLVGSGTRHDEQRAWLATVGARDALACPLSNQADEGVLLLRDRLGDTATFTRDDLAMLQTLAGHLAVKLRAARLVEQLRHDATHDPLTGLPNRSALEHRAAAALAAQAGGGPAPAVLALHLSKIDEVNAVLGHRVGDELVVAVAARLVQALPGAVVAHLAGHDFAVLLAAGPLDPFAASRAVAHALQEPVQLSGTAVSVGASTGIAVAVAGEDPADLLRRAGTAESSARAARSGPVLHTAALDEGRAERVGLLADLHQALEEDQLALHFQPKLDLALGVVTSVESLVRWDHPRLGRLSPDVFVPLAESTALVDPFSHHVLGKALRQARRWHDGNVDLSVAVNLSAHNLHDPHLVERVAAALATAGVPASRLTLELTESSLVDDPRHTAEVLEHLASIGVTISLDDFGTGYSSLSYLQRLPVRELKIDKSFVRGLESTASPEAAAVSAALIRSITSLKDVLGLRVVAEGVEDFVVLERLRDLGCDIIQGYVISRPLPADELDLSLLRWTAQDRGPQRLV